MQSQGLSSFVRRAKEAWAPHRSKSSGHLGILLAIAMLAACGTDVPSSAELAQQTQAARTSVQPAPSARKSVVWVMMKEQANLSAASTAHLSWSSKGQKVASSLASTAERTQGSVKAYLQQRGAKVHPFWIVNALRVEADEATILALSQRSDVARVMPDRSYALPPVQKAQAARARIQNVEWGLASIRAPEVWSTFGAQGDGVVIANIDSGVQFDHPALVNQYRGTGADGSVDHNYNWFDPAAVCGSPSLAPCDNAGHGTHTMGTMVGDDGSPGDNQIGVAPHARWIAAKGCESSGCSLESLLASAEWILAPTDLNGQNPRPDLRPHIVNNSWGGGGNDPFYEAAVQSWVAAGIFPAFSAGNAGPSCGTAGSPGDYTGSYAVGAYDSVNAIASFSSRGPSASGTGKPNIAAPGVAVRSSYPGDLYELLDGTSMASPHLAGTVALMWSAAPSLSGDIAGTRAILDATAIDTADTSCGGTDTNNNVWGEGRLDAFAAVDAAPRGPTGVLAGTLTDSASGTPIAFASIEARTSEGRVRSTRSDAQGAFSLRLPVGAQVLTVRAYGYVAQTVDASVSEGQTTTVNLALVSAPVFTLSGQVLDERAEPIAGVRVSLEGAPLLAQVTDEEGRYGFARVAEGDYSVKAEAGRCYLGQSVPVSVREDLTVDLRLATRYDVYGYHCEPVAFDYLAVEDVALATGDDDAVSVALPFTFSHYGENYDAVTVGVNGAALFVGTALTYSNGVIPAADGTNGGIFAFWDDLILLEGGSVRTGTLGTAPNRKFVIEWRDVAFYANNAVRVSFEIVLHETGQATLQYATGGSPLQLGNSATVGIEDQTGADGLLYALNEAVLEAGTAIEYSAPPRGYVTGIVTDANDGLPVEGAVVRAMTDGVQHRADVTDASGHYSLTVGPGSYVVDASRSGYQTQTRNVSVAINQTVGADFVLRTARAELTPGSLQIVAPRDQRRKRIFTLRNTGSLPMTWSLGESGGERQDVVSNGQRVRSAQAEAAALDTRALFAANTPAPRGWRTEAVGDVLSSFVPAGVAAPWGVGFDGKVWISEGPGATGSTQYESDGTPTGRFVDNDWVTDWAGDMAYDRTHNLLCQVEIGGTNRIVCVDPISGDVVDTLEGDFSWTSQRGLAYRADDDSFYVAGWNDGTIYHVAGLSSPDRGTVLGSCTPSDTLISGLAYNVGMGVLWAATNSTTDTIYELDPDDCSVLGTVAHPVPGFNGAGLEMDAAGNLWTIAQATRTAYLVESGVPSFEDVSWLSANVTSGTLAPGASQQLVVNVDTTGLTAGTYLANLYLDSNSGRAPRVRVPLSLVVTAYQQGIEAGGATPYTDTLGDTWAADKLYTSGSWGFLTRGSTLTTTRAIAGTAEQRLFKSQNVNPYAYRFDGVPSGVYQVELGFAELANAGYGQRMFDVQIEGTTVISAYDIRYEAGTFAADRYTFFVPVSDGRLDVRFLPRAPGTLPPVVNALRVTHRPDR